MICDIFKQLCSEGRQGRMCLGRCAKGCDLGVESTAETVAGHPQRTAQSDPGSGGVGYY